ncbi:MAG: carboxypeptidase M32 [Verrucomicrobiales bacterium]|nr:carboxypeptidase M32 [Verrucomicrobiales bacterium]
MANQAYDKLVQLCSELQILKDTQSLLSWDQEVNMAKKGVAYRAAQLSFLSGETHTRFTDPKVGDWIAEARGDDSLDQHQRANLREWDREYKRDTCLPVELVKKMAKTRVTAHEAWAEAREKSDFSLFRKPLAELIELSKEQVSYWGYEETPYNGLLDIYEKGATIDKIDRVFADYKNDLIPLVEQACALDRMEPEALQGEYPIDKQAAFNREVAASIGFDFDAGRIDTAVHPFCTGLGPFDTRLTTRYDTGDFRSSLYGVLHEAGHGLYDQGVNPDYHGTPCGEAVSLGVHESQSRLWENHVGRSLAFWEKWLPVAVTYFPNLDQLNAVEMTRAANLANKSFIRVEADEVTYDLHVILRYEIEKAIFSGELALDEIPDAWNSKFKESFGMEVDSYANGCLQDIHWSMGGFGYFPTYTLGNLNASHLVAAAREHDGVAGDMDQGEFGSLLSWMREKIHSAGSLYPPEELIERAAGKPVSPEAHLDHLRSRYL